MVALKEGQYAIGDFIFGRHTQYPVEFVDWGTAEIQVQDYARPRLDSLAFGRDTVQGLVVTFNVGTLDMPDRDMYEAMEDFRLEWQNAVDRSTPGTTVGLRYCRRGVERMIFGRPRRFSPIVSSSRSSFCQWICEFQMIDNSYYSAEEHQNSITIVPASSGGLLAPLASPLTTLAYTSRPGIINVAGRQWAWLRTVIHGPITRPTIQITGQWKITIDLTLNYDDKVEIDPTPGSRFIRFNDSINVSGSLTADSPYMSGMIVPPGEQEIILRGIDMTGTSHLDVYWRDRFSSM